MHFVARKCNQGWSVFLTLRIVELCSRQEGRSKAYVPSVGLQASLDAACTEMIPDHQRGSEAVESRSHDLKRDRCTTLPPVTRRASGTARGVRSEGAALQ